MTRYLRPEAVQIATIDESESVALDLTSSRYVRINRTAAFILEQCVVARTAEELQKMAVTAYSGIDGSGGLSVLLADLDRLAAAGLLRIET